MPPKRARKAPTALIESIEQIEAIPTPRITLGKEASHAETDELARSSPPRTTYPEPPSLARTGTQSTQPTQPDEESDSEDKSKLAWSEEMLEQLVEELYDVFAKGG
jgi:hypothetical protein